MIKLIKRITGSNNYSGSDWNFEKTTKYVFENDRNHFFEAGFYTHFIKDDKAMIKQKNVIELPSSYGCPMKCHFCASSLHESFGVLTSSDIFEIFMYLYKNNEIDRNEKILVAMSGTGELLYTFDSVKESILKIHEVNEKIEFAVSSCCWNRDRLYEIEKLSQQMIFRTIQFTHISCNQNVVGNVIEYYKNYSYDVDQIVRLIQNVSLPQIRINYLALDGINDSDDEIDEFIRKFSCVKDKIIIRISKLNQTEASTHYCLKTTSLEKMKKFQGRLQQFGFNAYLFYSEINDNMNCGQLIANSDK